MRNFFVSLVVLAAGIAQGAPLRSELPGNDLNFLSEQLHFSHSTYEGDSVLKCKHRLENAESRDWAVDCFDSNGVLAKKFKVHLWVTAYTKAQIPKLSFEILYWITDVTRSHQPVGGGSTHWIHLKEPTDLSLSQSTDQDTAALYLDVDVAQLKFRP